MLPPANLSMVHCLTGTGTALYNKESSELIKQAIGNGYTYIDGAQMYANSESVGAGIKASGKKREELYILTKCEFVHRIDDRN